MNNFTNRARMIIKHAHEEAAKLGHNAVGTEHILLGLLKLKEGVAYEVLKDLDISEKDILDEMEKMILPGNSNKSINPNNLVLTPRAKSVLQLSAKAAQSMGQNYVGTEHILIGLSEEGEGIAARALTALDIDTQGLIDAINEKLESLGYNNMPTVEDLANLNQFGFGPTKKSDRKIKIVEKFSTNLSKLARANKLDPVISRDKEIDNICQILLRRTKNNPIIIGEAGVGKTSVVYGLAQRIAYGNVPSGLKKKEIFAVDIAAIVAGTKYRGEFEQRIKMIIDEVKMNPNYILFIDEIHTVIGAGSASGTIDAAHMLKQPLAQGEIQILGATTIDEYKKRVEKDKALLRRFQTVVVEEPNLDDSISILKGLRDVFEAHHKVVITDFAIETAVKLTDRYISDRKLPDKAIDLLDEAGAKKKMSVVETPDDIAELEAELQNIDNLKLMAVKKQDFEKAAEYRDEQSKVKNKLDAIRAKLDHKTFEKLQIDEIDVAAVISNWTGIPLNKLNENESYKLLKLEDELHERVISQHEAITAVSTAIRRSRTGLQNKKRPLGSFLFLGPTGVGKTELAKTLAESLFGNEDAIIRIDMSEFMEKHSVSRLLGAPPGYVGYEEGGELTEKVRRKPFSVILLDEIEKAHPDIYNILLQVLDEGQLSDNLGHKVNFKNCIIIMTSNIGAKEIVKGKGFGFSTPDKETTYQDMKKKVLSDVKKVFRPEFLNRLDEVIVFRALNKDNISNIVEIMMQEIYKAIEEKEMFLIISESVKEFLINKGYDDNFGARPLRRAIQKYIEDPLSLEILENKFKPGDRIKAELKDDTIVFNKI